MLPSQRGVGFSDHIDRFCNPWLPISFIAVKVIGRVHRSVVGSLIPFKITLFLYFTSHFVSVKITLHPALYRTWMPMSEAIDNPGTICPVRIIGRTGMLMSHMCVE